MNLAIISFTKAGSSLNVKIKALLEQNHIVTSYCKGRGEEPSLVPVKESLQKWCEHVFPNIDGILFIGATGIAVRSIAPFLKDKTKDPLVLVIDEKANFVISLLSGHVGGANELAMDLSEWLHAIPVITTATDINQKFAVDVFAKKQQLFITDWKLAKEISALILDGKRIGLQSDLPIMTKIPVELSLEEKTEVGICISLDERKQPYDKTLHLIPKDIVLGVGCKKATDAFEMEKFILRTLEENNISIYAIRMLASIDLKANEVCIKEFAKKYEIPFVTYTADVLSKVEGDFNESDFVKQITGVGNVCERAAVASCKDALLLMNKKSYEGMTLAIAIEKEKRGITFE